MVSGCGGGGAGVGACACACVCVYDVHRPVLYHLGHSFVVLSGEYIGVWSVGVGGGVGWGVCVVCVRVHVRVCVYDVLTDQFSITSAIAL